MIDFDQAVDRIIGGIEKRGRIVITDEKKRVAYHESGHAIAGWFLEHGSPVLKVTIIPRGLAALGFSQQFARDQHLLSKEELMDMMCVLLGGRAAEELFLGSISTGARDDLKRLTNIAYAQIANYGMNPAVGSFNFNWKPHSNDYKFVKPFSEATAELIDTEARNTVADAYERTKTLLLEKKDLLEKVAQALLLKETLKYDDLLAILGKRPFDDEELWHPFAREKKTRRR